MYSEKNVCNNLLGTFLGDPHKSKDIDNAMCDLEKLGIKLELHLYEKGNKLMKLATKYTLSKSNQRNFCKLIRSIKFLDNFASNCSKNFTPNDNIIVGLKSHDCYVIMQRLLPVGYQSFMNKTISSTIIELYTFFKQLCVRTIKVTNMVESHNQLVMRVRKCIILVFICEHLGLIQGQITCLCLNNPKVLLFVY